MSSDPKGTVKRTCDRHDDCDAADKRKRDNAHKHGRISFGADHCYDQKENRQ